MATEKDHVHRARANQSFAKHLSTVDSVNAAWKVVVNFYAALHYVEAIVVRSGRASGSHDDRREEIRNNPALRRIRDQYRLLESSSRDARYNPAIDFGSRRDTQEICDLAESIRVSLGF